jgi:hypothetical protein
MPLPKKVRQRFRLANNRRKAWKSNPELMESIRQRATNRAKEKKDSKNLLLVEMIRSEWPTELSPGELKQRLLTIDYYNPVTMKRRNVKSLFNRLVRRKIIKYNFERKLWLNLTHEQKEENQSTTTNAQTDSTIPGQATEGTEQNT